MRPDDRQHPTNTQFDAKHPSNGSNGSAKSSPSAHTNGSSTKSNSNGIRQEQTVTRLTGHFFGHDREEVTRILIQSLTDLGYHDAAGALSGESGFELENPSVAAFRDAIQSGEWSEAESLLFGSGSDDTGGGVGLAHNGDAQDGTGWLKRGETAEDYHTFSGLPLSEGTNQKEMLFLIRQQKYLELLEDRDLGSALAVLRHELTPLHQGTSRLHGLSRYDFSRLFSLTSADPRCSLMMCQSAQDLRIQAQWDGAEGNSRKELLTELSSM